MTGRDNETPKGWAAVPGTSEKAPVIEIVIFVAVLGFIFTGTVVAICGVLIGLAGVV